MNLLSIGKFAKKTGRNVSAVRWMEKTEELIPHQVLKGGTRCYSMEQLKQFPGSPAKRIDAGYKKGLNNC